MEQHHITSRRTFLKLGAVAGLGALGTTALAACAPKNARADAASQTGSGIAASDIAWDGQFDVVVVGFGAAGAASAISAAEAGAQVLLVDKAPEGHEGGNSRFCAQLFVSIDDKAEGIKHYQAQRGDFDTPDDVIETYVEGMCNIRETLVGWGLDKDRIQDFTEKGLTQLGVEYPELPGSGAVRTNMIDGYKTQALWRFLKHSVNDRKDKIECWYEAPAQALIQDPGTGAIVGVQIKRGSKTLNIAAKNGVVLSCGGFENSPFYQKNYLGHTKMYPYGTIYNEGDGIAMVQAVGAKLWHMSSYESMGINLTPQTAHARMGGIPFFTEGSVIMVGGDGRRLIAEDLEQRHGHRLIGGTWVIPYHPGRNIGILDTTQLGIATKALPDWSDGCVDEIASGKLVEAASIAELAEKLEIDPDTLTATVDAYNASAASGMDVLGRKAESMSPIATAPFYGVEMWPTVLNTQGGPARSSQAEVLDVNDKPIPHLYSAGEFGGVNANMYQGGSNIAECLVFGNIAGTQAASAKEDAIVIEGSLEFEAGCGDVSLYDQQPDETGLSSNQAMGVGEGNGGPIWVKVTAEGDKVTAVEIVQSTETEGIGTVALEQLPDLIVAAGGTEGVDAVSGATLSSKGVLAAVAEAQGKIK